MKAKKIISWALLAAGTSLFFSCEKKDEMSADSKIYMPQAVNKPFPQSITLSTDPQTIVYGAAYGGAGSPTTDITVNFAVAKDAVATYNTANGTTYEVFPDDSYTLESLSGTIPKGQVTTKPLKINVIGNKFNAAKKYLLPVTIVSVSAGVINDDIRTTYFAIDKLANIYDGVYTVSGTLLDKAAATITGKYPLVVQLRTVDASTVECWYQNENDDRHPLFSGGSPSVYGLFSPVFTFDNTNKVIAVTNKYGQPSTNGRAAKLDPAGINKYNPATKTLEVSYILVQPANTDRTFFTEKFVYTGKRP